MNLVVGATGLLGGEICRLLVAEGRPVRGLVRPTSDRVKVERLQGLGVETVEGDLKDPPSLVAACRGASAVISTASSTLSRQEGDTILSVDREGQLAVIEGAKAAGVERFVLVSFPEMDIEFPLQTAKREVERRLRESGLAYTILQPTVFMEVWLSPALGFDAAGARVRIYGSGHNKISWISYEDVARFAAACVDSPAARNSVIELGGPEDLSPLEVVRIFEEAGGGEFAVEHITEEQLLAQKEMATDPLQESFAALMISCARGSVIDMRETLRKFPVRLKSLREYARSVIGADSKEG
ncbi:MAG: SDR family oxidoreductase [Pyrinomonadaceae bacterium]|nr:SDR family oxidoreductase [Pyrinomonadaceae bacterium]